MQGERAHGAAERMQGLVTVVSLKPQLSTLKNFLRLQT
jgi:hypothetical protein